MNISFLKFQVKPKVVISNAGPEAKMYKALLDLFNHGQTQGTEILTVTPYGLIIYCVLP